ncbi:hypothetical protein [Bradyrhizobium betae]|uniref:Tyr recombinase domain-containing protein n=2 Tax=Bradyrhizobium TaxID=374 RepID=A0A5P6PHC5_9BRAD|nr:hypothetical protein [Bradyrhizobium betae]MCS3730886.1 integrase [Bradyrhizobium betae]QFI77568.1 hypothetical protein F8237_35260 [Bradyrhizobium betae]
MRIERDGENHADISILKLRRQAFLDVVGDRTPDKYFPSHLQAFVSRMQYWPANVTKRADMEGKSTRDVLEENKTFALKTMKDSYVANVRTMMRYSMQDNHYRDPFAGVKIAYPQTLIPSKPREGVAMDVTNRVFRNGVASGFLDEAMLPLLAKLTSRRLGLLTFLRADDIRQKDDVWIAQTDGIVEVKDEKTGKKSWRRVPIKTSESMTFYVLHNYLDEIGFVAWMRSRKGFIFEAAREHPDPSKYMSKTMQNHMKRCGAKGGEVFHSLRGDAIDEMRGADIEGRARRLQSGHEQCTTTTVSARSRPNNASTSPVGRFRRESTGLYSGGLISMRGAVAELVGIEGGVVSGVINLESSGVEASDWRLRHDQAYHEA